MFHFLLVYVLAGELPQEPVVQKVKLAAQAVPKPAFKYSLLPPLREKQTGNAVPHYLRAISPNVVGHMTRIPNFNARLRKWLELPLAEAMIKKPLPKMNPSEEEQELPYNRNELEYLTHNFLTKFVDQAARKTHAEWEYLEGIKRDNMGLMLPEFSSMMEQGLMIRARARLELMNGNFDKMLYALQTGFAFSEHLREAKVFISLHYNAQMNRELCQVLWENTQLEKSPNLFWAMFEPRSTTGAMRQALDADQLAMESMLGDVLSTVPMTQEQMQAQLKRMVLFSNETRSNEFLTIAKEYPKAKAWFVAQGKTVEELDKLPATQVIFQYFWARHGETMDEIRKAQLLPLKPQLARLIQLEEELTEARARKDLGVALSGMFLLSHSRTLVAQADVDRELALLQCIEALRHFAATHQNQLPAKWEEIQDLPIPKDPITEEFFSLVKNGDKVTLTVAPFHAKNHHKPQRRIEVTVR